MSLCFGKNERASFLKLQPKRNKGGVEEEKKYRQKSDDLWSSPKEKLGIGKR